jgi:hypothetical protein
LEERADYETDATILDPTRAAPAARVQAHSGERGSVPDPVSAKIAAVSAKDREPGHRVVRGRRERQVSLLIGLCCLLVYNLNGRAISAGDTYPARYLPFAIWHDHTVFFDPIVTIASQGRGDAAFWLVRIPGGHVISLYPVTLPVLIAPLYLPAVAYLNGQGWTDGRLDHAARVMEKVTASLLASLSASLLYLVLRRRATVPIALLLTLAFAFGTTTWVISSQALWQHGIAQVLVCGALLILTGPCTAARALAVGMLCGLIAANRPPDVILAAALGTYGLWWAGELRRAALLAAAAMLPMGLVLFYNLGVLGNFGGGYGLIGGPRFFQHDLLPGIGGLLVSPTRGLFVFSPFLLFLVLAWRHLPRDRAERVLSLAISAGVVLQLVLYAKADWRGGMSWGPRYMTDLLPLLIWMLVPVVAAIRGVGRVCFVSAVGVAIAIEAIGAFCYTGVTDIPIFAVTSGPHQMQAAWAWRNAPFVASLQHGLAPAELMTVMRGSLDTIEARGRATSTINAGEDVIAAGWALAGRATPSHVAVVIDGRQTFATSTFSDRPDIGTTASERSRAGWRIPLATASLPPGQHRLAAFVWASAEGGEAYFLAQRTLTVQMAPSAGDAPPPEAGRGAAGAGVRAADGAADADADINDAFRIAVARLRAHQQAPGYWLTAYTSAPHFQDPRPEMNTFLTSLLVDLLDPLTATTGLGDSVSRAREHLTGQIEDGGLVRYHGRPDAPGIGTLGCVITPDTDDTALVWRIAPSKESQRLPAALATIDRYRTGEGLYRSWLARREDYQCLDPGSDPNPTDIAIQMHVLLLLAKAQPPAGHALCDALRRVVDQDRVWVYYRRTPLVPILRLPDLQRAGCALTLPESRMQTLVPGQEIWVSLVRLLAHAPPAGAHPIDAAAIRTMLHQLAKDDFGLVRASPPLLYHNDLTATVPRYYWSEDVGYALWLRLADGYAHLGRSSQGN